jgi:hypothetical protein
MTEIPPDDQGRRALQEVWGWLVNSYNGFDDLENYTVEQLEELQGDLERAAAAVRRHIVHRGDEGREEEARGHRKRNP